MKQAGALILTAVFAFLASVPAAAQTVGKVTEIQGMVNVKKPSGQLIRAALKTVVAQGDEVRTEKGAKVTILFQDGSILRLGPNTTIRINKLVQQKDKGVVQAVYEVVGGTVMSVVGGLFGGGGNSYQVKTPTAVSGVRGTMFIVQVVDDPVKGLITKLVPVEGTVHFAGTAGGEYMVGPGQFSWAGTDGIANAPIEISEEELMELIRLVTVDTNSLDDRASDLRRQGIILLLKEGVEVFIPPELILPPGGGSGGGNPENLASNNDNPFDLIYQEPPQMTELILTIYIKPPT